MVGKVLEHTAEKYENVKKGVKSVMGGKVLEYEAKTIRNEGIKEGLKEGIKEEMQEGLQKGRMEMLFDLVQNNLLTIREAASQVKLTEEAFREKMMESGR